jgi:ketosteroid isomerase-like protein
MSHADEAELLAKSQQLLDAIAHGDWGTYSELCDPSITAFEPEALGRLVQGLDFHSFYFKLSGGQVKPRNSMQDVHIRVMGDVAVVCYYRLTQFVDGDGHAGTRGTEETRVWQKTDGRWRHVHFHRSPSQKT